jgi:hypothetical protein
LQGVHWASLPWKAAQEPDLFGFAVASHAGPRRVDAAVAHDGAAWDATAKPKRSGSWAAFYGRLAQWTPCN